MCLFDMGFVRLCVVECKGSTGMSDVFVYKYDKRVCVWSGACGTCCGVCEWCKCVRGIRCDGGMVMQTVAFNVCGWRWCGKLQ